MPLWQLLCHTEATSLATRHHVPGPDSWNPIGIMIDIGRWSDSDLDSESRSECPCAHATNNCLDPYLDHNPLVNTAVDYSYCNRACMKM